MPYDSWGIALADGDDKEREFILMLRDSSLPPANFQWTSEPMSEKKIREEVAKFNAPTEKVDDAIEKARKTRTYQTAS